MRVKGLGKARGREGVGVAQARQAQEREGDAGSPRAPRLAASGRIGQVRGLCSARDPQPGARDYGGLSTSGMPQAARIPRNSLVKVPRPLGDTTRARVRSSRLAVTSRRRRPGVDPRPQLRLSMIESAWHTIEAHRHAREVLATYGRERYEREPDRVRLALLKLSDGDLYKLSPMVAGAKRDYRNV
jgi:hypothetical protein